MLPVKKGANDMAAVKLPKEATNTLNRARLFGVHGDFRSYEAYKRELTKLGLSCNEYQEAVKKLSNALGV